MEQIAINMLPKGVRPVCHSSQFDEGRQIWFNLFNDAAPYILSGSETISVSVRKPDGTEVIDSITNTSDSYVVWEVSTDACEISGVCECELSIVENGIILGSKNFTMKVEEDAFNGKNIEVRTATGSIATFNTNMVAPFRSLKSDINPVQDLHGYSKPWRGGGGKNKLMPTAETTTINGITFTVDDEGVVTTSGTFSSNTNFALTTSFLLKAGTYILNGCPSGGSYTNYVVRIENAQAQRLALDTGNGEQFTLSEDTNVWCRIYLYSQDGVGKTFKPMVRLATESDSSFAPYENICPISGFTALNVTRTGKNLVDNSHFTYGLPNTSIGADLDNIITSTRYAYFGFIPPKATCIFSTKTFNRDKYLSLLFYGYKDNKLTSYSSIPAYTDQVRSQVFDLSEFDYFRICIGALSGEDTFEDLTGNGYVQLELGSTATDYEAYNGQTKTVNFGQTVYKGMLNVNSGVLNITHAYAKFSDLPFYDISNGSYTTEYRKSLSPLANTVLYSEKHGAISNMGVENTAYYGSAGHGNEVGSLNVDFAISTSGALLALYDADTTLTREQFEAKYADFEVLYPLATPIEVQLTPEQVSAIVGQNNVYSDTNGDTEVEYYIEV